MLYRFCQLRSSWVFNYSHSTSRATREYGTVPERIGLNDEPTNTNEEPTKNAHSSCLVSTSMLLNKLTYSFPYSNMKS